MKHLREGILFQVFPLRFLVIRKQEADHARLKLVHHTGGLGGVNIFTKGLAKFVRCIEVSLYRGSLSYILLLLGSRK